MPPEQYQRASDLFNQLRETPESERAAALDAACPDDLVVRSEVQRLLEADRGAGSFLERPAIEDAARILQEKARQSTFPGTIGHYKVLSKLGEGGMGEVWRAYDSKLNRQVAIKMVPEVFGAGRDLMDRLAREAQVLASLNHPNIAAIYGVEDRALVMELVEGPTLAERIAAGPMAWEEVAELAIQIAGAMEAAHEKGVVHRDLKPANIKVTVDGRVKVLDFGLAKAVANQAVPAAALQGTTRGMILGTAPYMAPEQVKGGAVDRRADIWAFGVVLYEMLTGRNLFQGETVADTLAAIMKSQPDWETLPVAARPIVERCLRKDPRRRWQSIGDTRLAIEEALERPTDVEASSKPGGLQRIGWGAVGAISAAAALSLAYLFLTHASPMPPPVQFTVNSPGNGALFLEPALRVSPNGEFIAFLASDAVDDISRVYLYTLATGTARALPGTERTRDVSWSFDSASLLLSRSGRFSRMEINANAPQPLPFESGYASWGPDGVVSATREGVQWFHPEMPGATPGATPGAKALLTPGPKAGVVYLYPTLIPGSRWMVYNSYNGMPASGVSVEIASVDGREQRKLFSAERTAVYAGGYLLYLQGSTLTARAIDPASGQLRGDSSPVAGPVEHEIGGSEPGYFSASHNGVLAFRKGKVIADDRLVWFDRSGKRLGTVAGVADYSNPALSPDEHRLAVGIRDPGTAKRDIWILDLARGTASKITFDPADHSSPAWSPDGSRIAFSSDRRGARDLYVRNASGIGEEELLLQSPIPKNVEHWSPDGRSIVYNEAVPNNGDDLSVFSLDSRKPRDFLRTRFLEDHARFSPDGKWLAYQSDESGREEVYIQPFPPTGEKWQISNDFGGAPQWRGDGRELFYSTLTTPSRIMAVEIEVRNKAIQAGLPRLLFEVGLVPLNPRNRWVVTRDGKRFLAVVPADPEPVHSFSVIVNWPSLLKKR